VKKQTEQANKVSVEEEMAAYNERVAIQKQRFIDGEASYTVYEETVEQMEMEHLNRLVQLYEEGSKEQIQVQKQLQDKLFSNQRKHQKETEEAEKKNQDEWTRENAKLNRDRADFGILVNLAQSANYKRDKVTFAAEKKAALARLRKNYRELLRGPIPKSRKVFILGFVISYPVTAWFINTVSNRNRR
jgi:hypothetical protein